MAPRIVFIGAGSLGFTRSLVRDMLTFPTMEGAEFVLMDIDKERLSFIEKAAKILVERGKRPAKVIATMDRKEALKGATAVICTILNGGVEIWGQDITIPKKYGVDTNVGDTRSVSGIFRALRTIPVMVDIARDMERLCPNALFLNYTNPMAMLCRAIQRESSIQVSGLCHSVQGTAEMLAKWIGAKNEDIDYLCAGINHQSFYLKFLNKGKDAYPAIRKAITTKKAIYDEEIVRNEMFLALDYYVTESSGHNSEYCAWFRKRPDLLKKYCSNHKGAGWNPGEYAFILKEYQSRGKNWKKDIKKWFADGAPFPIERGLEYAASIVNALLGGVPFEFNGNVPNTGLIDNLPARCCVEVPVIANRRGLTPTYVGPLPAQCAALVNLSVAVEEMAVEAALTGDPRLVYQAVCHDPLSAAVLSLAEIKKMVQEMLDKNKKWLPKFKSVKIG